MQTPEACRCNVHPKLPAGSGNPRGRTDLHQHMTPQRAEKDLASSVKYELDLLKLQPPGQCQAFLFAAPTGPRSPSKCFKHLEAKALSKCGAKLLK